MPTAEYTSQLPGHVDEGDQGVNATQWLHGEPVLVTVSGDGSVGMWDVTLGQPCVRHIVTHTRCANAVSLCCNILLGGSFNLTSFDALFFFMKYIPGCCCP